MLVHHGWKSSPSPRRGFTVISAAKEVSEGPVVVAVHDPLQALRLFRSALDEALFRYRDLVVLDYGIALHDELEDESGRADPRERLALRAFAANPHVHVVPVDPDETGLEGTVSYCESTKASLLVLGADHIGETGLEGDLANRIFNGGFDVLVVTRPAMEPREIHGAVD